MKTALIGWPELIIILVIIIFVFGASRIKQLAKAVGESVRELTKGTSEPTEEEKAIVNAAKKMGIETEGKTVKQIADEMTEKAAKKSQES